MSPASSDSPLPPSSSSDEEASAWQSFTLTVSAAQAEAVSELLLDFGALSAALEDADADTPDEVALYGLPDTPPGAWRTNRVSALFAAQADLAPVLAAVTLALGESPVYQLQAVATRDWVRETQAQFSPIVVAERLCITPSWHAPNPAYRNLMLDPGLAFGTGSHPTTLLCLEWLVEILRGGETLLDYGCGSGILALAAQRLGAASVSGVDLDPQAVAASIENTRRNQLTAAFFLPDTAPQRHYDCVIANILTQPLRALAPLLAESCRPDGRLALSGILSSQAEQILDAYSPYFTVWIGARREGWCRVDGVRAVR